MNTDKLKTTAAQINLPVLGILAFSLCSVNSIFHLLSSNALHPSPVLWLPAVLVELVTAWAVYQVVETMRKLTKSRISKQDRRFYLGILAAFVAVSLPLVGTSVWANVVEFGGSIALGALFPVASIGCAIGAALPQVTQKYLKDKEAVKIAQSKARSEKQREAREKRVRSEREASEKQREASEKQRATVAQEQENTLRSLGSERETYSAYLENPGATQAQIAEIIGKSRRTVVSHTAKLEQQGIIKRNGNGLEVVAR